METVLDRRPEVRRSAPKPPAIDLQRLCTRRLEVSFAADRGELLEAQRLRYRVFAQELGAQLDAPFPGIDADLFDAYCHHLLVRETQSGEVVGTYRLLRPEQARALGKYYSDDQFDLSRLNRLRPGIVELGRACIAPAYRTGTVIGLLWAGIGQFMQAYEYRYLMGSASIDARDGGHLASSVYAALSVDRMACGSFAVKPRIGFPLHRAIPYLDPEVPPLIKGYLRAGGKVCGAPAWDKAFGTADLLMLLDMRDLAPAYARRFLPREEPVALAA
jgi:putative hemolysin